MNLSDIFGFANPIPAPQQPGQQPQNQQGFLPQQPQNQQQLPNPQPQPSTTSAIAQLLSGLAPFNAAQSHQTTQNNPLVSLITTLNNLADNTSKLAVAKTQVPTDLFKKEVEHKIELGKLQDAIIMFSKQIQSLEEKVQKMYDATRVIAESLSQLKKKQQETGGEKNDPKPL